MASAHTELGSACLSDELITSFHALDSQPHGTSSPAQLADVLARLGGRFAADVADVLQRLSEQPTPNLSESRSEALRNDRYEYQQLAMARLRAKNVEGAIDYIQRHAPQLTGWLETQIKRHAPHALKLVQQRTIPTESRCNLSDVSVVPDGILIDAAAGRIARILGQFRVFRAWAYAQSINDGHGWVERHALEDLWQSVSVATGKRQARRIIQQGIKAGYWTQDTTTKRIYLIGQVKLGAQLVKVAIEAGYHHLIETNKPGKRRVKVNLAGSLQQASAQLYAAWLVAKDPERKGTTISRELLCELWQVSTPTLLEWETIAQIEKQVNYAQHNDTSLDGVPAHAYLTLNRDGSYATAWQLPNTYSISANSIQQHSRTGKATKVRQAVGIEIALAEQRGSIGDAALPRSGKRYFTQDASHKIDAFRACSDYIRKLSRRDGDVFQRRYFYVGRRYGVRIFEPYNINANVQQTTIYQRLIWQEGQPTFRAMRKRYRCILEDHHNYMALFN